MKVIAIYNMKGGVGKTTTAANLAHLAAAAGQRTLLWDLDPQAASSFAFRVRPRVPGFGRSSLDGGLAFAEAIKETDYDNLDLLPADFAYRKLDRLLGNVEKPERAVAALIDAIGGDYDAVFLDCPAGFSLLTQGVIAAADALVVPTIPSVLSLRTVARLVRWADRVDSPSELAAFFSMVDRRKTLHRRACEWADSHPEMFLTGQVPYASVVEQMAVRRMPLAAFAAKDAATVAFAGIWAELQTRLQQRSEGASPRPDRWRRALDLIESLIAALESEGGDHVRGTAAPVGSGVADASFQKPAHQGTEFDFVHGFDTEHRDLQNAGFVLELRERGGSFLVVADRSGAGHGRVRGIGRAEVCIDRCWAMQILTGEMSPLAALEHRLGRPLPRMVESVRGLVGGTGLKRIDSRQAEQAVARLGPASVRPFEVIRPASAASTARR